MNWRSIRAIAGKDLLEVRHNRIAVTGAVLIAVMFAIVLPLLFTQLTVFTAGTEEAPPLEELAPYIPPELLGLMDEYTQEQFPIVLFLGYLLAPLFLVLPLMLASIIAAEAFVGEKERKTLEALIYTPVSDLDLYTGKVLASAVPATIYTWINFGIYTLVVNLSGYPIMGKFWFPTDTWWVLILWVTPAIATLGVAVTVLVSSKVHTFMEAYQASGALVLIVIALLFGQLFGLVFLTPPVAFIVGLGFFAADAACIWIGVTIFSRGELITRI